MSLTQNDFPNPTAYNAYLAQEAARKKAAEDAAKKKADEEGTKKKSPAATATSPTPPAAPAESLPADATDVIGRIEPIDVTPYQAGQTTTEDEDTVGEDGLTAYQRKLIQLQEDAVRRQQEALEFRPREDARDVIRRVLTQYKLESLTDIIWNKYAGQEVNIEDEGALIYSIREEEAYKKRFAANQARIEKGLAELLPSSYLELEDAYRRVLSNNGMPPGFYDSEDDFTQFIANDISVQELQNRIQQGYRLVADADPEVRRKMEELYGVSEGDLAAYFIDPNRARPLLVAADYQRQARAAQIAARAQEQAGIRLEGGLAEDLARRGVTQEEAMAGFGEIGALGELRQRFAGEEDITEQGIVGARFGIDVQAAEQLERRKQRRVAAFAGGGSFARTTGATSGATRVAVGGAE